MIMSTNYYKWWVSSCCSANFVFQNIASWSSGSNWSPTSFIPNGDWIHSINCKIKTAWLLWRLRYCFRRNPGRSTRNLYLVCACIKNINRLAVKAEPVESDSLTSDKKKKISANNQRSSCQKSGHCRGDKAIFIVVDAAVDLTDCLHLIVTNCKCK